MSCEPCIIRAPVCAKKDSIGFGRSDSCLLPSICKTLDVKVPKFLASRISFGHFENNHILGVGLYDPHSVEGVGLMSGKISSSIIVDY